MKPLLSCLLVFATLAPSAPAAAQQIRIEPPRVFDIVPPEGRSVEMVDGLTVVRLPGATFGTVVTFMPESADEAWIPLVVLNSGAAPLEVGLDGVSARYGNTKLKVHSTTGIVKAERDRRQEMLAWSQDATGKSRTDLLDDRRRAAMAMQEVGSGSRGRSVAVPTNNDSREARKALDAQLEALQDRLFDDATLQSKEIARGDVKIDLPPRRRDGEPTEFVLTLAFGGETKEVLYRERDPRVDVGDVITDETTPAE